MSYPPQDDRTVLATATKPLPADGQAPYSPRALPIGTHLGEFEVTGLLGEGGFGIVYLAYDGTLERQVAIKEYMPSFAWRSTQAHVSIKSTESANTYEAGLRSFINEARMLAQFDHAALVKVYRFWEANGTAYMVMPYYRGATLKQTLQERTTPPDEAWLKALLGPLLAALDVMHQHQCFHRDIAPDNILMLEEGHPLLLDFGAARRAISGMNQAFTVILKQNYAPIEQYAEMPGMRQGAWTDLYALASVVHFAIDGHPPPPALSRMMSDPYVPLASRYADRYSVQFLDAIDRALSFKPENRPQSVAEMRAALGLGTTAPQAPAQGTHAPAQGAPASAPGPAPTLPAATEQRMAAPKHRLLLAGLGVGVLGAAVLGAYTALTPRRPAAAPAATSAAAPPASTSSRPPAPPATRQPFEPIAALGTVLAGASPQRKVTVEVASPRATIGRDKLGFSIRSAHAGYVYVYLVGTEGNDFHLLFPNARDHDNRIAADEVMKLPRHTWPMGAFGPPGTDHFVVMVSDAPRDFSTAGLTKGDPFPVFPMAQAARLQAAYTGKTALFAGVPNCAVAPCSPDYGAAAFSIDEVVP